MVAKRAVRKQQDTSRPAPDPPAHLLPVAQNSRNQAHPGQRVRSRSAGTASSALNPSSPRGVLGLADAFNAAVAQAVADADPEAVHRVRTGSRRLQATLEAMLREGGPAAHALERPARAWLRELKQVRRAAGAVRDLDVQRKLLENWIGKRGPVPDAAPDSEANPLPIAAESKQAEALDAWLKGARKHLARSMQKQIRKRQQGLASGQGEFFTAITRIPLGRPRAVRSADAVALEDFVRAADAMPLLHMENLHDFRKATKKARYVAEAGTEGERHSSVAKALKQVQDAIGEWHDWVCLGEEAKAALGQDAPELTAAFRGEIERHFAAAVKTTQSIRGRLLGEWMASKSPGKRPPTAVTLSDRSIASRQQPA
jgi:CHAD domain-containing protein